MTKLLSREKSIFFIILAAALLVFGAAFFFNNRPSLHQDINKMIDQPKIKIGQKTIFVEIADTQEKRKKGLSGREYLHEDSGMLFVFKEEGYYPFWMKDMKFPMDIIWIDENKVIDITHDAEPEGSAPEKIYRPAKPARYVLEVNAGFALENNVRIGDPVKSSIFQ